VSPTAYETSRAPSTLDLIMEYGSPLFSQSTAGAIVPAFGC